MRYLMRLLLSGFLLVNLGCSPKMAAISTNLEKFTKNSDVKWASPKGFDLTMDIYTPTTGKKLYPVIVIFHGGAWLINNKSIMQQSAEYLVSHGEYVVCNVNYRLLSDANNTISINEVIEDAFGAVIWVKENIEKYKGNSGKIIVTGDSAGGHLAAMVCTQGKNLRSTGFSGQNLGFNPTYLPRGKTAEQVGAANGLAVQAAMLSYAAFDIYGACADGGFEGESNIFWSLAKVKPRGIFGDKINCKDHPDYYRQVSPIYQIPDAKSVKLPPMLLTAGEKDDLVTPASVQNYMKKLSDSGHKNLEFWEHKGRPHAFLDSGSNAYLGISFEKDAPPALDKMLEFLNKIFYR